MSYYKRKLPHWQPSGAEYFITTRLKGSLPKTAIWRLSNLREQLSNSHSDEELQIHIQRKIFESFEHLLDGVATGPTWLGKEEVAELVQNSIMYRDSKVFDLYAYCIMPNHLHLVFKHLPYEKEKEYPITDIMRNFKRYTARKSNEILNRTGAFWQPESYDRVIRDQDELENTIRYTLNNPVKAGLISKWEDWPHNYCKPAFVDSFN